VTNRTLLRKLEKRAGVDKSTTMQGLTDAELNYLLVGMFDDLISSLKDENNPAPNWLEDFTEASRRNDMMPISDERRAAIFRSMRHASVTQDSLVVSGDLFWERIKECCASGPLIQLPTRPDHFPNAGGEAYLRAKANERAET